MYMEYMYLYNTVRSTAVVKVCCSLYCCSLLDLLADRKDKSGKTGKVLINGQRRQPNYKNLVGYVVQVG